MPERKNGGGLHGSNRPGRGLGLYHYNNGQFYNGLTTVTYELEDTYCNGGGFCCIPVCAPVRRTSAICASSAHTRPRVRKGSHKANIDVPSHMRDLSKSVHATIKRVPAKAGDCIIFTYARQPWV